MNKSKINNVQPEQELSGEQKADVKTSSPAIANAPVGCSLSLSDVHIKNKELWDELWQRGLYVNPVGHENEIHYLVVSHMPPKDTVAIDHNANLICRS